MARAITRVITVFYKFGGNGAKSYIQKTAFSGKFRTNSPSPTKAAFKY
jgi:hypothetical protein